jgi:hypothetical protein
MFDNAFSSLVEDLKIEVCLKIRWCSRWASSDLRQDQPGGRAGSLASVLDGSICWQRYQRSRIVGSSDEIGAYPKGKPTTPAAWLPPCFQALGIDLELAPRSARPAAQISRYGVEPIGELFW